MVTYSLSGADAEFFQIDPNTGKLTYADDFNPQFETPQDADGDNAYEINVIRSGAGSAGFNEPTIEPLTIKIAEDAEGGDDSLVGNEGDDYIDGEGGDDTLVGGSGDDTLEGGFGDDVIFGDNQGAVNGPDDECDPVLIDYANYDASASTASSSVYHNAAVVGGQNVSVRIISQQISANTVVSMAQGTTGEIVLDTSASSSGGLANFKMEFFDPITNQPVVLNPVVVFSDLDDNIDFSPSSPEVLKINSGAVAVSVNSTTNLDYNLGNGELKVGSSALHSDSQYGDPDSSIAVKMEEGSEFNFVLFAPKGVSKFNFGNPETFPLPAGSSYNDSITGGWGNDRIKGEQGNDTIDSGGHCDDETQLCDSTDPDPNNDRDLVKGGSGDDLISTGDDQDTVFGGLDDDTISGGMDADDIYGGAGDDSLMGEQGNDTLRGGTGNDEMFGGDDRDVFLGAEDGDCIDGGTGSKAPGDVDDYDILDLSHLTGPYSIDSTLDDDGNSTSGTVNLMDTDGFITGQIKFNEIEQIVCFTAGTMIATNTGERKVEDLKIGDLVLTRDNGLQAVTWAGSKAVTAEMLREDPELRPVMIKAGSLGADLPATDLMVSPNHRVLIENASVELMFDEPEVLVAAKHLVGKPGIYAVDITGTDYVHFMCERHEVVLSNGAWTESFQPGEQALNGVDADQRQELFKLFPELETEAGREEFVAARMVLKSYEAQLAL